MSNSKHSESPTLTIAASTYLNSAPLIWSFLHGPEKDLVKLVDAVPARCAELLRQSAVDVALIPVIEYQRIPNITLIPEICVGSKTEVRSVVLIAKSSGLDDIRTVAIDESSRTSATLVKIIFREFLQREPTWTTHTPDLQGMLADNDAALVIGDPAMTFSREGLHVWDMAALWRKYTGFGFIFAMWVVSDLGKERAKEIDFIAVRDYGVARIDEIVDFYLKRIPLTRAELRSYLIDNISFNLDESMRQGMNLYFELAAKHRLIDNVRPALVS